MSPLKKVRSFRRAPIGGTFVSFGNLSAVVPLGVPIESSPAEDPTQCSGLWTVSAVALKTLL